MSIHRTDLSDVSCIIIAQRLFRGTTQVHREDVLSVHLTDSFYLPRTIEKKTSTKT
jgi:hypothetical protein